MIDGCGSKLKSWDLDSFDLYRGELVNILMYVKEEDQRDIYGFRKVVGFTVIDTDNQSFNYIDSHLTF